MLPSARAAEMETRLLGKDLRRADRVPVLTVLLVASQSTGTLSPDENQTSEGPLLHVRLKGPPRQGCTPPSQAAVGNFKVALGYSPPCDISVFLVLDPQLDTTHAPPLHDTCSFARVGAFVSVVLIIKAPPGWVQGPQCPPCFLHRQADNYQSFA